MNRKNNARFNEWLNKLISQEKVFNEEFIPNRTHSFCIYPEDTEYLFTPVFSDLSEKSNWTANGELIAVFDVDNEHYGLYRDMTARRVKIFPGSFPLEEKDCEVGTHSASIKAAGNRNCWSVTIKQTKNDAAFIITCNYLNENPDDFLTVELLRD